MGENASVPSWLLPRRFEAGPKMHSGASSPPLRNARRLIRRVSTASRGSLQERRGSLPLNPTSPEGKSVFLVFRLPSRDRPREKGRQFESPNQMSRRNCGSPRPHYFSVTGALPAAPRLPGLPGDPGRDSARKLASILREVASAWADREPVSGAMFQNPRAPRQRAGTSCCAGSEAHLAAIPPIGFGWSDVGSADRYGFRTRYPAGDPFGTCPFAQIESGRTGGVGTHGRALEDRADRPLAVESRLIAWTRPSGFPVALGP